jgi:hypothetical protein
MRQITGINLTGNLFAPIFIPQLLFLICIMFALCFNFMPLSLSYFMMAAMLAVSLSNSIELSAIVFMSLLVILFLYIRIAAKESILIFFTVLAFYFKVYYIIPLIAGVYFGLTSVIPVALGTFLWRNYPIIKDIAVNNSTQFEDIFDLVSVPERIFEIFNILIGRIVSNQYWIFESLVLGMVVFFVFFISRMAFDFSKEIAIIVGALLNIAGFFLASVLTDLEIPLAFLFFNTLFCMVMALIVKFFDKVLIYKSAERLEFEDEEFYYFVKAVPKIKSSDYEMSELKEKLRDKPKTAPKTETSETELPKAELPKPELLKTPTKKTEPKKKKLIPFKNKPDKNTDGEAGNSLDKKPDTIQKRFDLIFMRDENSLDELGLDKKDLDKKDLGKKDLDKKAETKKDIKLSSLVNKGQDIKETAKEEPDNKALTGKGPETNSLETQEVDVKSIEEKEPADKETGKKEAPLEEANIKPDEANTKPTDTDKI